MEPMCVPHILGSSMGRHWSAIHHLHISHNAPYLPPPPLPPIFFFSWVSQPPKGKLKTMLMQNFWGANKVHFGRCASGVLAICFFLSPLTVPEVFAIVNSAQFNFLLVSDVALLQWYGHLLILPLLFGLGSGLGLQRMPISLGFWE